MEAGERVGVGANDGMVALEAAGFGEGLFEREDDVS